MEKITYKQGKYSQIKLNDGTRIYIETLPNKLRIKKMFTGFIPTKTLWEFKFPFYIRTVNEPFDTANEILDLTISNFSDYNHLNEIENIFQTLGSTLKEYAIKNEQRAQKIAWDKLGNISLKAIPPEKQVEKLEKLKHDLDNISEEK